MGIFIYLVFIENKGYIKYMIEMSLLFFKYLKNIIDSLKYYIY